MENFKTTLQVPHAGAKACIGRHGIGCAGIYRPEKHTGLVIIADGREYNTGASATNAVETVLTHLVKEYGAGVDFPACRIVELDSDGKFDYILPSWPKPGVPGEVGFAPLRHDGETPRSEQAFLAEFGLLGEQVLFLLSQAGPYGPG